MKTEQEIRKILAECEEVSEKNDWILSNDFHSPFASCPFTNEVEACLDCTHEQALKWVLEDA